MVFIKSIIYFYSILGKCYNEKTVLANEYTIVDENAGYNFLGFCYTVSGEELFG